MVQILKALNAMSQSFKVETGGLILIKDQIQNEEMAIGSRKWCAEWSMVSLALQ